jgi:hypothetical protein
MNITKWTLMFFVAFLIGCQSQKKETPKEGIKEVIEKSDINEQPIKKEVKDFAEITESELQTLIGSSKIGRVLVFRRDSVLEISSDRTLTYALLGKNNSVKNLQEHFGNIFNVEHQEIVNEMFEELQKVSKLTYKESFVKTYINPEIGKNNIVSGKIENAEIILAEGIHVGISKDDFFGKLFKDASSYDFSIVDTFYNGDEAGEIHQYFIFSADTLKQVILKSEYDWIPFDL